MIDKSEMIFGVRAVIEAIQAGKEIDKILVKKDIQSDLSKELFAVLKGTLIPVQRVPVERINRVTRKNHQGVIAFISYSHLPEGGGLGTFFRAGQESSVCDARTASRMSANFGVHCPYLRVCGGGCRYYSRQEQCNGECRCGKDFGRCVAYLARMPRTESERYPAVS